jgi:hypothetical protein
MIDPGELRRLESLVHHFEERKNRARGRLDLVQGDWWCFGLLGFAMQPKEYMVGDLLVIRKVEEPPGEVELAGALKSPALFSAIGRYSHGLQYELAVNSSIGADHAPFTLAWWVVSAIRAKTLCEILVPAVANLPWSTIAAADPKSVHVQLLEDVPSAIRMEPPVAVAEGDLDWVFEHLTNFARLLEDQRFFLAVEALTTHHHQSNLRMMTAAVWAGIEALFRVHAELRFRLSAYIAAYVEPAGAGRLDLYRELKRRYDFRSRAVHGAAVTDEDLREHVQRVRSILARLICKVAEAGGVPSADDFDGMLFSSGG